MVIVLDITLTIITIVCFFMAQSVSLHVFPIFILYYCIKAGHSCFLVLLSLIFWDISHVISLEGHRYTQSDFLTFLHTDIGFNLLIVWVFLQVLAVLVKMW